MLQRCPLFSSRPLTPPSLLWARPTPESYSRFKKKNLSDMSSALGPPLRVTAGRSPRSPSTTVSVVRSASVDADSTTVSVVCSVPAVLASSSATVCVVFFASEDAVPATVSVASFAACGSSPRGESDL